MIESEHVLCTAEKMLTEANQHQATRARGWLGGIWARVLVAVGFSGCGLQQSLLASAR